MQKQMNDSTGNQGASKPEKLAWVTPTLKAEPIGAVTQAMRKEEKVRVVFGQDVLLFGS